MEVNPDTRPLPEGWTQHYEPFKQLWYYVQTNVMPPKVSFTHPLDAGPSNSKSKRNSKMSSMDSYPYAGMEMPQASMPSLMSMPEASTIPNPPQPKLTRAQELYASSARAAMPMISTRDIQTFSTLPNPSFQSAVSPVSSYLQTSGSRPLPGVPPNQHPNSGHASLNAHHNHHLPQRTQSLQHSRPQHGPLRTQTYAPGQGGFNPNTKQNNGPRNLTTKAAPPSQLLQLSVPLASQANGSGSPAPSMPAPLSPLPLSGGSSGTPMTTPSPPASSVLFSSPSSIGTPMSSPLMSPPTSPPAFATSPSISPQVAPHVTGPMVISPPPPPPKPATTNNNSNAAARLAVGAMFKIAGGVLSATTGSSSGLLNTVGKIVTNPTVFNTLTSFGKNNNTGVSDADFQAVMQAKPGANYQGVINALVQQQQAYQRQSAAYMQAHPGMPPPPAGVDYQALIAEVQRLQKVSQQQQQQQQTASHSQLQQNQIQQLAQQQQAHQWAQQQQYQAQQFAQQQQQAQHFVPQQQQQLQTPSLLQQPQQQAPYTTQQQNPASHEQQAAVETQVPPSQQQQQQQQQPQNSQNHYVEALHAMQHLYHDMTDQQQQQPQQQQQSQQPAVTDTYNNFNYSFGGDNGYGQQQPQQSQQSPMADIFNNINSALGVGNGQSQPTFDPSSLYNGDPNNGAASGGGGGLLDALTQTLGNGNSGGGQTDGSGMVALLTGVNQAFNPLNNFGQGGIDLGFGNNNTGWQ